MRSAVKKFSVIALLLLQACAATKTTDSVNTACPDTPYTVVPYWIDGVIYVSSAMADKDRYWIKKYKDGNAKPDDLIKVLESNVRFHEGMVGRMQAAKEEAAVNKEIQQIDSQEEQK